MFNLQQYLIAESGFCTISLSYKTRSIHRECSNLLFTAVSDADSFISQCKQEYVCGLLSEYMEDMEEGIENSLFKKFRKRKNLRECKWGMDCINACIAFNPAGSLLHTCKQVVIMHEHLQAILPSQQDFKLYEASRERLTDMIVFCKAEISRESLKGVHRHPLTPIYI